MGEALLESRYSLMKTIDISGRRKESLGGITPGAVVSTCLRVTKTRCEVLSN